MLLRNSPIGRGFARQWLALANACVLQYNEQNGLWPPLVRLMHAALFTQGRARSARVQRLLKRAPAAFEKAARTKSPTGTSAPQDMPHAYDCRALLLGAPEAPCAPRNRTEYAARIRRKFDNGTWDRAMLTCTHGLLGELGFR